MKRKKRLFDTFIFKCHAELFFTAVIEVARSLPRYPRWRWTEGLTLSVSQGVGAALLLLTSNDAFPTVSICNRSFVGSRTNHRTNEIISSRPSVRRLDVEPHVVVGILQQVGRRRLFGLLQFCSPAASPRLCCLLSSSRCSD